MAAGDTEYTVAAERSVGALEMEISREQNDTAIQANGASPATFISHQIISSRCYCRTELKRM